MKRGVLLTIVFTALSIHAAKQPYETGQLVDIVIKDMTVDISLPVSNGPGPNNSFPFPLHLGVNYQFQIQAGDIVYVANCWSKSKRNFGSEWVVKDPVEFRVVKDRLFLKRTGKSELRLGLMTRARLVSTAGTEQRPAATLPPFATRQTAPECR
jgi:hypothetical protein